MSKQIAVKALKKGRGLLLRPFLRLAEPAKIIRNWQEGGKWADQNKDLLNSGHKPLISIIVPTYKRIGPLVDCIASIRRHTTDYEIIVVNSGSGRLGDQWLIKQRQAGDVILIFDNGRRFGRRVMSQSYFYNLGYQMANGKYVVHFADDCQALPGWTTDVISKLDSDPDIGLALFLGQPHEYGKFQNTVYTGKDDTYYPVAHWFCARKTDLASIGFMDEDYSYYYNDLDLTVRVMQRLRKRVKCSTKSKILHIDKALTYRTRQPVNRDLERFNTLWKHTVGFGADDKLASHLLSEEQTEDWIRTGKLL